MWPNDLDLFLHVNNGVYFSLCDLARVDLMLRSRTLGVAAGPRRPFLVAAETIQIHRSLRLFQRFRIETRVIGWDDRAFFVQHRFATAGSAASSAGEATIALAVVEGRVFDRNEGHIAPSEVVGALGVGGESPDLPEWVERWRTDQRALRVESRGWSASTGRDSA